MHVGVKRSIGVTALVIGASSGFATPVNAAPASPVSCTGNGAFTAGMLDVPCVIDPGLTGIHIVAVGAPGGSWSTSQPGGHGAIVTADMALSAGTTIILNVGGSGAGKLAGGANGGGPGGGPAGGPGGAPGGGSGGGASDIRIPSNAISDRVLVAGGGGGGGFGTTGAFVGANADGGSGGFLIGATSAAGTTAGHGGSSAPCGGADGDDANLGAGGMGFGGGGGGGGLAGGGGGGEAVNAGSCSDANGGGGGGGSSLVPMGGSKVTDTTGIPMITITAPVPATSSRPTTSGTAVVGQTLTESHAPWTNAPTAIAVQWLRCDTGGSNCLPIGTGAATYTLTADDAGHTIKAQETASNFYGSSIAAGAAGTVTSTPTAVVTSATIPPPTITATSPACQQIEVAVTNNNASGSAVQYTVTATSGPISLSRMTTGTALPGQTSSVRISDLPSGGPYTVTANGDDGSATAAAATVKVAECAVNDFKAKIGKGHFKHDDVNVRLINRRSNVAVAVTVVSVHHSSHKYTVKAHEVRTVEAFIAPRGHSKIKVVDAAGVQAKRKFFRQ